MSPPPPESHLPAPPPRWFQSHRRLVEGVAALARRVQSDKELTALIRRKFAIKCTTGVGGGGGGDYLEGRSAGNDLNQLAGDDGLARAVERDGQLVNHLTYRGEKNSIVRNSVDNIAAYRI